MSEAEARDQGVAEQTQNTVETIARASNDVIRETSERFGASAREGMRQASAASAVGAEAAMRTGASLAAGTQDITKAWADYAEEVMRRTSEASRALIGCRSLTEMFEIQAQLLRSNTLAFLDQSSRIAEIAGRMATRPFNASRQASDARPDR